MPKHKQGDVAKKTYSWRSMRLVMCIDGNLAQSALMDQSGLSGTRCSKGVHGGQWTVLQVHTILSTLHDLWA